MMLRSRRSGALVNGREQNPLEWSEMAILDRGAGRTCPSVPAYGYPRHCVAPAGGGDRLANAVPRVGKWMKQGQEAVCCDTLGEVHLYHVQCNLNRRLAMAMARGDRDLVALLQKESQQLALQDVAC